MFFRIIIILLDNCRVLRIAPDTSFFFLFNGEAPGREGRAFRQEEKSVIRVRCKLKNSLDELERLTILNRLRDGLSPS